MHQLARHLKWNVWPQEVVVEPVLALIASKQIEQSIFAF
jgi:hypothetical protein